MVDLDVCIEFSFLIISIHLCRRWSNPLNAPRIVCVNRVIVSRLVRAIFVFVCLAILYVYIQHDNVCILSMRVIFFS